MCWTDVWSYGFVLNWLIWGLKMSETNEELKCSTTIVNWNVELITVFVTWFRAIKSQLQILFDILDLFPRPQVKDAKSLFTRRLWFYWIEQIYHGFNDIKSFDYFEHLISRFNDNQKIKFSSNYLINYFTILFPQKV